MFRAGLRGTALGPPFRMAPISQLPVVPESARNLTAAVSKHLGYNGRLKAVFFKSRGGNVARVQEFL